MGVKNSPDAFGRAEFLNGTDSDRAVIAVNLSCRNGWNANIFNAYELSTTTKLNDNEFIRYHMVPNIWNI